jgi:hypothetical protein
MGIYDWLSPKRRKFENSVREWHATAIPYGDYRNIKPGTVCVQGIVEGTAINCLETSKAPHRELSDKEAALHKRADFLCGLTEEQRKFEQDQDSRKDRIEEDIDRRHTRVCMCYALSDSMPGCGLVFGFPFFLRSGEERIRVMLPSMATLNTAESYMDRRARDVVLRGMPTTAGWHTSRKVGDVRDIYLLRPREFDEYRYRPSKSEFTTVIKGHQLADKHIVGRYPTYSKWIGYTTRQAGGELKYENTMAYYVDNNDRIRVTGMASAGAGGIEITGSPDSYLLIELT